VGAYYRRVLSGIKMVVSANCRPARTEVDLRLVVDSKWAKDDPRFVKECVEPLKNMFSADVWALEFPNYRLETVYLDLENEDENTLWLLNNLLSFFKKGPNRRAFVDLTSAPRDWLYSAFYVSNFFSDTVFYYVKPARSKSPAEYSLQEMTDEGTVSKYPIRAQLTPPLSRWLRPREENSKENNIQYEIFRLIYQIASENLDISKSQEIEISLEQLAQRAKTLPYYRGKPLEDVWKGMSRYFTDIDRFGLFKRFGKMIVTNRKGIVLMRSLFEPKSLDARPP